MLNSLILVGGLEHVFYFFHNIWDNPSHWLSYFSEGLKPPTRKSVELIVEIKAAGPVHFTDMSKEASKFHSEKFPAPDDPHFWPKSRHGTQQEDLPRRGNQSSLTWWSYTEKVVVLDVHPDSLTGGLGIDPSLSQKSCVLVVVLPSKTTKRISW